LPVFKVNAMRSCVFFSPHSDLKPSRSRSSKYCSLTGVPGENVLATLKLGVHMMRQGEFISDHEVKIGNKVAEVLCGGAVSP